MKRIRQFFNGPWFLGLAAFSTLLFLMYCFMVSNQEREQFFHSRAGMGLGVAAILTLITYLVLLPKGAIRRFVKGPGFVALIAIAFTAFLTYAFITA